MAQDSIMKSPVKMTTICYRLPSCCYCKSPPFTVEDLECVVEYLEGTQGVHPVWEHWCFSGRFESTAYEIYYQDMCDFSLTVWK